MQNNLIEVLHRTASFANSLATIRQALDRMAETEDLLLQKGDLLLQKEDLLLQRRVVPLGSELLIRTLDGWILIPKEDVGLVMGMAESAGLLEPGTRKVVTELLTLGGVMIDVGAHVGCLTLAAARKVGDSGHVIAFEPTPRTVGLLRANIRLNGLSDRTTIHACAAGARYEFAMLNLSPHHSHNSLLPLAEATDVVEVEVQPIDAVVAAGRRVDLVKIDAEGAELSVWQGMQRVINDNPQLAVIVELGPSHLARANISLTEWLAELSRPGFTAWEIDETSGSLQPLRPISDLEKVHSVNLLLLRDHPLDRVGLRLA